MATTTFVRAGTWTLVSGVLDIRVRNWGLVVVHGTIPIVSADVQVSADGVLAVDATADLAAIDTGNPKRDSDLAKPRLLDTGRHPVLRFQAAQFRIADGDVRCAGHITARGATAEVQLAAVTTQTEPAQIRVVGSTRLDRAQLGMKVPRLLIGRWIDVDVTAIFRRPGV